MERTRALVTGPAGWAGRLLLLGAVGFWWGAVVVPNLISLAFPEWLSPDAIPRDLNPDIDWEGGWRIESRRRPSWSWPFWRW